MTGAASCLASSRVSLKPAARYSLLSAAYFQVHEREPSCDLATLLVLAQSGFKQFEDFVFGDRLTKIVTNERREGGRAARVVELLLDHILIAQVLERVAASSDRGCLSVGSRLLLGFGCVYEEQRHTYDATTSVVGSSCCLRPFPWIRQNRNGTWIPMMRSGASFVRPKFTTGSTNRCFVARTVTPNWRLNISRLEPSTF